MAKRDLNLNSLGRYGKSSERLILEAHGHCEVPAGCGGIVLRWRNPNSGLIFLIRVFAQAKYSCFIDGTAPPSGRPLIPFGTHVFSLVIDDFASSNSLMAVSLIHDESKFGFPNTSRPSERTTAILTAADGSWKYATTEPATENWKRPGFDDSTWAAIVHRDPPKLGDRDPGQYQLKTVTEDGAACLGTDKTGNRIWIRREFTVSSADPIARVQN